MYQISSHDNFLLVRFSEEIRYSQILSAIEEVLARADFPALDDIWVFEGKIVDIRFEQLEILVKAIQTRYPQIATRTKTALVTTSGFAAAIVAEFLKLAQVLPYDLQLFSSIVEAEGWILQPDT